MRADFFPIQFLSSLVQGRAPKLECRGVEQYFLYSKSRSLCGQHKTLRAWNAKMSWRIELHPERLFRFPLLGIGHWATYQ